MISTNLNKKLKDLLLDRNCYNPATIFNPLSARMAEQIGFKIGIVPWENNIIRFSRRSRFDVTIINGIN
jgi:hypothetical protein